MIEMKRVMLSSTCWYLLLAFVWIGQHVHAQSNDAGPAFAETIEYINGKLDLCAVHPDGSTKTAIALRNDDSSKTALDVISNVALFVNYEPEYEWMTEWWLLEPAARIQLDLTDLISEVAEPSFITEDKRVDRFFIINEEGIRSYYVISLRCFKKECLTRLNGWEVDDAINRASRTIREEESSYKRMLMKKEVNFPNSNSELAFMIHCGKTEAERLQKAFSHLITLAGGKPELF